MIDSFDRRRAERFFITEKADYLLASRYEGSGCILDVSETGLALILRDPAREGDEIIVNTRGLGRLAGRVVRTFRGGVGIILMVSDAKRALIGKKIAAMLNGVPYLRLFEDRSGLRCRYNIETTARCGERQDRIACTIVDMSDSGCLLQSVQKPPVGERILIGMLRGWVVRHSSDGFAIEFIWNPAERRECASASSGERMSSALAKGR